MSQLTIRDVRAIITQPPGARTLVIVKVETNEPELYGLGRGGPRNSDSYVKWTQALYGRTRSHGNAT